MDENFARSFSLVGFIILILYAAALGYIDLANPYQVTLLIVGLAVWIKLIDKAIEEDYSW